MLKSHGILHSMSGRRQVLVVDDELINRELLGMIVAERYEVLYAENGAVALDMIRENAGLLSLVLLDIMMPVMDGFEVLTTLKEDPELRRIPVIVLTSEKQAEVKALHMGAADFITKPYDLPEVILARIDRSIELSEDTYIIQNTEQDEQTGLYNQNYFFRYVEQYEQHHPDAVMDAIALGINHFTLLNELYGREYSTTIVQRLADNIRELIADGGLACRSETDVFYVFLPHQEDPETVYEKVANNLADSQRGAHVRIHMGIYPECDRTIDAERRFDHAKMSSETLRSNLSQHIAIYDNSLHEKELFQEHLLDDIDKALNEHQFIVYYQPKYAVQGDKPRLASAEALVRWIHPEYGMVSPGVFIPLFEENGLISRLDRYVWTEAARQIRAWRDEFGISLPVSVNMSRIDMYDPELANIFLDLVKTYDLDPHDYLLEVTESAYTDDSGQLIQVVSGLRDLGFRIEMDDFGSGYSSLNMLASLPIDVLKLDMIFVRNLQKDAKNLRIMELMMDIARFLKVPVVCEGVEEASQVELLKSIGCDMIQGYYFSKPVPAAEFSKFIEERIASC